MAGTGTKAPEADRPRKEDLRISWWKKGAAAAERIGLPVLYFCPLCLTGYSEEEAPGYLTLEHVPPQALGGRRLVLTCKTCNSEAGHQLDCHAIIEEQARRVVADETYGRNPVRVSFGGVNVNAELSRDGVVNQISILPHNPPGRVEEFATAARTWGDGTEISVTFKRQYEARRAMISWLRSAYLAAFARFGYRYIARDVLQPVRDQIQNPERELITNFLSVTRELTGRQLSVIHEPASAKGIAVSMDGRVVLLPFWDNDYDLYTRLGRGPVQLRGQLLGWPERPEFRLDSMNAEQLKRVICWLAGPQWR
jgi:HNH endonuclease